MVKISATAMMMVACTSAVCTLLGAVFLLFCATAPAEIVKPYTENSEVSALFADLCSTAAAVIALCSCFRFYHCCQGQSALATALKSIDNVLALSDCQSLVTHPHRRVS
jgi:hypothetical protein